MPEPSTTDTRGRRFLLAAGLLLVSLNLRPLMSALSAVLGATRRSAGLSILRHDRASAGPVDPVITVVRSGDTLLTYRRAR